MYHNTIVFTKSPLSGFYRYKDEFQIYPMEMPDVPYKKAVRDYPNVLEYFVHDDEQIKITNEEEFADLDELSSLTATTVTKKDRLLSLLTAFTNNRFFVYDAMDGFWALPLQSEKPDEVNKQTSVWCMSVFHFPDLVRPVEIEKFKELTIQRVALKNHRDYYMYEPNLDSDRTKEIVFPSTIDEMFQGYFSLGKETRTVVDSAISYALASVELKDKRKTLSLLASFTSMETMVNLEFKEMKVEQCPTCNQPQYSIARKFRDFLLRYLGDTPANKKKFNAYYSLRSKIVHTGERLKTESLWADVEEDEKHNERIKRIEILQLGKLAIVTWLVMRFRVTQSFQAPVT